MTEAKIHHVRIVSSFLAFILGLGFAGQAVAQSQFVVAPLSLSDLDSYFESIHPQDGGLAFKRNPKGRPLTCQIGSDSAFISQPGSVFEVKFGSCFRLFDRHSEIKFLTYGASHGMRGAFLVEEMALRDSSSDHGTVHVGLIRMTPYFTGMQPSDSRLEINPILTITDASSLLKAEKECTDTLTSAISSSAIKSNQ